MTKGTKKHWMISVQLLDPEDNTYYTSILYIGQVKSLAEARLEELKKVDPTVVMHTEYIPSCPF